MTIPCKGCLLLPVCITKIEIHLMNNYYTTYFDEKYSAILGLHMVIMKCKKLKDVLTNCFKKGTGSIYTNYMFFISRDAYHSNKTDESDILINELQVLYKLLNYQNIKIEK